MPGIGRRSVLLVSLAVLILSRSGIAFQASPASIPQPEHRPQLIPRSRAERERRFLTQHRILLNVGVSDASGKPYADLKPTDFTVYDNDQARKLVEFRRVEGASVVAAAHIILVLDAVNSYSRDLRYFVREIEVYLAQGERPLTYPISIGVFSGSYISLGSPLRDRGALLAEIKSRAGDLRSTGCLGKLDKTETVVVPFLGSGHGYTSDSAEGLRCQNERFTSSILAIRQLAQDQVNIPGRAIVIWVGSGWPVLDDHAFAPDPPTLKRNFFEQLVSLSTMLREAQVTLDAVASPNPSTNSQSPGSDFLDGISNEEQVRAGNLGLHALAHQTGGHIVTDRRDLAAQIGQCIADAQSYYVLSFDSPPALEFGEYHSLAVKVNRPDLNVRTNTLYYAEQ